MSILRNIAGGLRSLFRKEQVSHELDEELNAFLEMAGEEKMKQGMSRKDALRAVRAMRNALRWLIVRGQRAVDAEADIGALRRDGSVLIERVV